MDVVLMYGLPQRDPKTLNPKPYTFNCVGNAQVPGGGLVLRLRTPSDPKERSRIEEHDGVLHVGPEWLKV